MAIVVGYVATDEGRAALARALDEARLRGARLLVVDSSRSPARTGSREPERAEADRAELAQRLAASGVAHELHPRSGPDPADDIIGVAAEHDAELIVIGLRRRTPVGKLILGSNAQRILLEAPCPVLAVKAEPAP
ncbi:universal stress protein [Quadrisphaera sp. DSM 44207]|uniref:universal stress protein n=1 Tax=Quadrisphaera sp. DSM 44207 TaxID=1881057 RepID=UPI00087E0D06|nr:universal stress protein [Quadrisphaera sp. DSM 44207]SDQ50795.1 Nucleotide-binding universal stress protein, UspA family [Quadrisphaera sp. DSM 44207]